MSAAGGQNSSMTLRAYEGHSYSKGFKPRRPVAPACEGADGKTTRLVASMSAMAPAMTAAAMTKAVTTISTPAVATAMHAYADRAKKWVTVATVVIRTAIIGTSVARTRNSGSDQAGAGRRCWRRSCLRGKRSVARHRLRYTSARHLDCRFSRKRSRCGAWYNEIGI